MRSLCNRVRVVEGIARNRPTKQQLAEDLQFDVDRIYGSAQAMAATVAGIYGGDVDSIRAQIEAHMGADCAQP